MSHMPGQHLHSGACFSLPREFFIGAPQAVFDDPPFQCFRILSHCLLEASQFAARVVEWNREVDFAEIHHAPEAEGRLLIVIMS